MAILCVISARGGSQGLPSKNTKPLLGKPLIAWSIEQAHATPEISRVVVSTDSQEIAAIARKYGAATPFSRPSHLATEYAGKWDVWQHALSECEAFFGEQYEAFVDLDCTNPLRDVSDISNVINKLRERKLEGVKGVFTTCPSRKNPYFNMLEVDTSGALTISKKLQTPIVRRQDAPQVYDHVASIYALEPEYLRSASGLLDGYTEGYDIGYAKSFDIDSHIDFVVVQFLMARRETKEIGG